MKTWQDNRERAWFTLVAWAVWGILLSTLAGSAPTVAAAVSDSLVQLEKQVQEVAKRAIPATVCVLNPPGSGSGVIISEDGYVLTASHVSAGARNDKVRLILSDGRQVEATALGANRTRDAAILKIDEPGPWPHVPMGRSSELKEGDWVIALGHPGGYERGRTPPVRLGRLLGNVDGPFGLITDCTVIGGDSGGPLFNVRGEVVGIHSSIAASTAQNRDVPIDVFHRDWDVMLKGRRWGKLAQMLIPAGAGYLGVVAEPLDDGEGLKVVEVEKEGAAEKSGIAVGDILVSFDGYHLSNTYSLVESVAARLAGDVVKMELRRDGKAMTISVKLGPRPGESADTEHADWDLPSEVDELLDPMSEAERPSPEEGKSDAQKNSEEKSEKKTATKGKPTRIPLSALLPPSYFAENSGVRRGNEKPSKYQKKHPSVLGAFRSVAARAALSTVAILNGSHPLALGTLVNRRGDVVTKASELHGDLSIRYPDGTVQPCRVVGVHEQADLALLRPDVAGSHGGVPARWNRQSKPVGSLVITPDWRGRVLAVGVVSVASRRPRSARAFLGIATEDRPDGVTIVQVVPSTAAAQAGIQVNDILLKIGNDAIQSVEDVFAAIAKHSPGEKVEVQVRRNGEELTLHATLKTPPNMTARRFEEMNRMSGARSSRRSGFPQIVQHDAEIPPFACGGPLVDLDGKIIGINIARVGRVETDAVPADWLEPVLTDLESGKLPPPEDFGRDDEAVRKEIAKTKAEIRRLQRRLRQLEQQLRGAPGGK